MFSFWREEAGRNLTFVCTLSGDEETDRLDGSDGVFSFTIRDEVGATSSSNDTAGNDGSPGLFERVKEEVLLHLARTKFGVPGDMLHETLVMKIDVDGDDEVVKSEEDLRKVLRMISGGDQNVVISMRVETAHVDNEWSDATNEARSPAQADDRSAFEKQTSVSNGWEVLSVGSQRHSIEDSAKSGRAATEELIPNEKSVLSDLQPDLNEESGDIREPVDSVHGQTSSDVSHTNTNVQIEALSDITLRTSPKHQEEQQIKGTQDERVKEDSSCIRDTDIIAGVVQTHDPTVQQNGNDFDAALQEAQAALTLTKNLEMRIEKQDLEENFPGTTIEMNCAKKDNDQNEIHSQISESSDVNKKFEVIKETNDSHGEAWHSDFISDAFNEIEQILNDPKSMVNSLKAETKMNSGSISELLKLISELAMQAIKSADFGFLKTSVDDENDVETMLKDVNIDNSESILEVLRKLGSNEKVVRSFQELLCSKEVRDFVLDICRNDVRTKQDLKKMVLDHLGYLLPAIGILFQKSPQVLIALPHTIKLILDLLEVNYQNSNSSKQGSAKAVVHENVMCDGCLQDINLKSKSIREGKNLGNLISGTRYKSAVRADFDLCEACESSGVFDHFGPYLKIRDLHQAPKEFFCLFEPSIYEKKENVVTPKENVEGVVYAKVVQPEVTNQPSLQASGRNMFERQDQEGNNFDFYASQLEQKTYTDKPNGCDGGAILTCPRKSHPLKEFVVPNRLFACDVCDKRPKKLSIMYGCRICDWDMCLQCAQLNNKHIIFERKSDEVKEVDASDHGEGRKRGSRRYGLGRHGKNYVCRSGFAHLSDRRNVDKFLLKEKNENLKMKFVKDETMFDGCVLQPGQPFRKVWKVKNTSDYLNWPVETRLIWVSNDSLGANSEGYLVVPLPANEVGRIWVDLKAPMNPGRYTSFWSLCAPKTRDGVEVFEKFGDRLWVDVNVVDPGKNCKGTGEDGFVEMGKRWVKEMQMLAEMNFRDMERNFKMLEKMGGDVSKVVENLLKQAKH